MSENNEKKQLDFKIEKFASIKYPHQERLFITFIGLTRAKVDELMTVARCQQDLIEMHDGVPRIRLAEEVTTAVAVQVANDLIAGKNPNSEYLRQKREHPWFNYPTV